jgi:hypothetical protein
MQTFLPSGNSLFAAQALDNKRLNKQILEGYQILNVLAGNSMGWRNHPAVLMWKGHEGALLDYIKDMITEAKYRGIKTENNEANINRISSKLWNFEKPSWMQDKEKLAKVVATHRANLYRKDPIYYAEYANAVDSRFNKPCCDKCLYFWPTHPRKVNK